MMRYKNPLCIYPYKQELKAFGFFPPIGIEYIASAIEDIVDSVKIIDLRYEKKPLSSFIDKKTDLVLVSYNWGFEERFVKYAINSIPKNITVILGGRHATEHVEELFENIPRIDGIVRGDGEETAREIVQKGISRDIDGLSFRLNGKIVHNNNRRLEPVRSNYFPNRKLRRYKYMVTFDEYNSDIQIDLMLGSRGCPFNCKFCDFKFNPLGEKRKWSCRTPESVISEIKTIEAEVIGFADDIFTADMDWVEHLCDLLIKEGIRKKYVINARLEVAKRPDVLKKMYKTGFAVFLLGIESAHDKTLASMNKGFTVAKIREYFEVLKKFNFIYHCYFILGNIGETKDEILDIIKLSRELGMDTLGLSILRASKYSPIKEIVKQLDDYHIEEDSGKVYSDMLSIDELQQIRRDIYSSFFTIQVILRILKKLIIHRFLTIGRFSKIIIHIARKKMQKMAKKRNLTITIKELKPIHKI
ncbi:MAG: B12-binding domain-containing radical SAM protein [Deltaproteobacteria bacterium]|nr:B12-binding domain-containing radical SAM protein [Deltaproteobacteria bacterium]MBW1736424.1 B12-binding domain-containing radical SAM protein [Deltaproteobacteria bacterium]MBW1907943.1 B12-binding domain-containing radical SAM protein [Deltaproteobacteria bacterium]MBW2033216.1 B12-binding domain-containing radical SAM protein [Deltaproteobacteria bacterium]MBW2113719.1 B12-binding domain-containing radical SAM protein [Deltaproteobacteria bacterium]